MSCLVLAAAEQGGDAVLLAQLHGTLGQVRAAYYDAASQLPDGTIAFQRLRQRPGRAPMGLAYSLACRAYVLGDQGEFAQAQAAFDEALSSIQGSNHAVEASILRWRAAVLLWQGRWSEAQICAADSRRIGSLVRSLFTCAMGHAAQAYGQWMASRAPAARQDLLNATHWLAPRGGGLFSSLDHGWLAEILVSQGEAGLARHNIA